MDDITPEMNWEAFNRFEALFSCYEVFPLLGVVPNNQDDRLRRGKYNPEFWDIIRALHARGWLVAQHGYTHQQSTKNGGILNVSNKSEFAGVPYAEQYEKIKKGKALLSSQGIDSDIWMSPSHSYDRNTLSALTNLGFRYITDGYSLYPYSYQGLKFIPCQISRPYKSVVGCLTVCIHCNSISDEGFQEIASFLTRHSTRCASYDEALKLKCSPYFLAYGIERCLLALRSFRHMLKNYKF